MSRSRFGLKGGNSRNFAAPVAEYASARRRRSHRVRYLDESLRFRYVSRISRPTYIVGFGFVPTMHSDSEVF
jgi:hypothetical protein